MDGPDLETRQMRYFLAVAERGSFTRAADDLRIAQPSLSQAISRLERQLGVPLFHRVGRRIVLSDAGRDLLEPCRTALRAVGVAQDAARSVATARLGRLSLAAMPAAAISPGVDLVSRFTRDHPGAELTVVAGWTDEEIADLVRQGRVEVGLVASAVLRREQDLAVIPTVAHRLVFIARPQDAPPGDGEVSAGDLRGGRLITSRRGTVMRRYVDDVLVDHPDVAIVCEIDHRAAILPLVRAGVGATILPAAYAQDAAALGLVVRTLQVAAVVRTAVVCRRDDLTPLAAAFVRLAAGEGQPGLGPTDGSGAG